MQIVYERCAGLDLHKKSVVACVITPDTHGQRLKEHRTFSSMTPDLLPLERLASELGRDPRGHGINWSVLEAYLQCAGGFL